MIEDNEAEKILLDSGYQIDKSDPSNIGYGGKTSEEILSGARKIVVLGDTIYTPSGGAQILHVYAPPVTEDEARRAGEFIAAAFENLLPGEIIAKK